MGKHNPAIWSIIKTVIEWIRAKVLGNQTVLNWVKALGPYVVVLSIIVGILTFYHEKEKEAAARLLNTITLLDKSKSQTVRAGAVTTLRVYLDRDYDKYQDRAIRVLACHLATEDDELVRETILNVLKEAKADAVAPLVLMNQILTDGIILDGIEEARSKYELLGEVKLKVSFQANKTDGNRTEGILTIEQDGEVLAAETLNVAKEKDRNDFMTNLTSRYPNFCEKTTQQLRKQMLQIAVQQVSQSRDDMESEIAEGVYKTHRKNLLEAVKRGEFHHGKLHDINKALVAVLRKSSTKEFKELDLSKVFLVSSERIDLNKAQLKGAILNHAVLYNVDLTNAVLEKAKLNDVVLEKVILKNAKLNGASLARANLASDDLRNSKFVKADLCDAILQDADMAEAILDNANMYGADLTNAILEHASLRSANMTGAHLELANLKFARLESANLSGADLSRADLTGAYLTNANLAAATLQGAELEGADLAGANLENADLRAKVLFGIDSKKFQSDLDKGTISEILQQEFEDNGFYLSRNTAVSVEEKDRRWLINDKDNEQTYTVRKEERLNICTEPNIVETKLFGIDSKKFQSDLDKCTISEDLRQEFENNRIDLSQDTCISIEEKDRKWLINEKDYGQTYTVRKEDGQLKIYERTELDPTELFSVDSKKFQSDLDKATISEDLRQEFEDKEIFVSQDATVSVREKGINYLIFDDGKRVCRISKEQENLNIYIDAILKDAHLEYADLTDADLTNANLVAATLIRTNMVKATLQGADLFEADLTDANLVGANLTDANMVNATLQGDDLFEADLTNANLAGANLEGANFQHAILEGANIRKAINWQKAIFDDDVRQKLSSSQD